MAKSHVSVLAEHESNRDRLPAARPATQDRTGQASGRAGKSFATAISSLWVGERQAQLWPVGEAEAQQPARAGRRQAIAHIIAQDVRSCLAGWPFYGVAFFTLLAVIGLTHFIAWFASEYGPYVLSRPFLLPAQVITTMGCLTTLFAAALWRAPSPNRRRQTSWPTRNGDTPAQMIGYFLARIAIFGLLLLILIPISVVLTWSSYLVAPPWTFLCLIPSFLGAALAASMGMFIAVSAPSRETAVGIAMAVAATSLAIQGGQLLLGGQTPETPYQPFVPLLRIAQDAIPYLSPFSASNTMLDAAWRFDFSALFQFALVSLVGVVLWLLATTVMLRRREKLP